ncbi:MAG: 2-hydroxychromene-2-carboxylate isomerase [Pseudomonadota bacterium]
MTVTAEFHFDFGSPNAYFCARVLPEIEERTGVTFQWVPVLLGGIFKATENQAPWMAFAHVKGKVAYEQLEITRFQKDHGITNFLLNPNFPMVTLMMMRGATAVEGTDDFRTYCDACFRGMWEDGKKMDDPDILLGALNDAGLDGAAIFEKAQTPDVKAKLIERTNDSVERGAFGIPTFFVGDEMFWGKERLGQIEAEIMKQKG